MLDELFDTFGNRSRKPKNGHPSSPGGMLDKIGRLFESDDERETRDHRSRERDDWDRRHDDDDVEDAAPGRNRKHRGFEFDLGD